MLRQALLAAVAISYLICVLIMSGMQKEDLDVSLLRKLQRYNVNIGDMDNEKVRRECSTRNEGLIGVNKNNNNNMILISTTERPTATTTSTGNTLKGLDIEAVLYHLKSQKKTVPKFNQTTTEKYVYPEKRVTAENEYFEDHPKIDLNLLQKYIQLYSNNKSDAINYNVQTEKLYPKNLEDVELIGNIFNGNIMQKEIPSITAEYATKADPIKQNIFKQIYDLLTADSKANNKTGNTSEINNKPKYTTRSIFQETHTENIFDKINPQIKSFYYFLNVINQFRTHSSIVLNQKYTPVYANQYDTESESPLLSTLSTMKKIEYYEEVTTIEPENKLELKQKLLSPSLVREIAESVKNVIIKDLRKELSDIYIKTTQSTTVTTSTATITTEASTTNINEIDLKEKTIMEAFMELCNKIKTLKQTTFGTEQKIFEKPGFNTRQKFKMPPLLPIGTGSQVESIFLPIFDKYNDQQTVYSSDDHFNRNQLVNINSYHAKQIKRHQSPITIQTNSVEIKPLAVPVTKPESIIRQNIIVSHKDIIHTREDQLEDTIPKQNGYLDVRANLYNSKRERNPYSSVPKLYGYQEPINREDVIRFRIRNNGNSKLDTDYYEKINFDSYNIDKNRGLRYDHVIPRFHKRWEGINDRIPAFYDNDNMHKVNRYQTMPKGEGTRNPPIDDIPSRNQMSLIDMKKGSSFDDTHFKNFLKSQQKVTDILEKILANKPQTNMPPVVEIT